MCRLPGVSLFQGDRRRGGPLRKGFLLMPICLREIAELVRGKLTGDGTLAIAGTATLRDARPDDITLADHHRMKRSLAESSAAAAIVPHDFQPEGIAYIAVDDVHQSFATLVARFRPPRAPRRIGISPAAHISPSATLGPDVDVHQGATIGDDVMIGAGSTIHAGVRIMADCKLGRNVTIFPNAVLYERTVVGPDAMIHAGAVLGGFGFGYQSVDGAHRRCAQLGHVEIGADVDIGAATTIDRGTYGPTTIGEGTKIDNQVMIAHNCRIGRRNLICSQVGIAGSATTGDDVVIAGQAGICDHVQVGDRVVLGAKAGVTNDIRAGTYAIGSPAKPNRELKLELIAIARLPEIRKQLKALQRRVDQLSDSAESPPRQDVA